MPRKNELGAKGEALDKSYLEGLGVQILAKNWRKENLT
jgi:Holliday junction resolvase-like predicted endonuclease